MTLNRICLWGVILREFTMSWNIRSHSWCKSSGIRSSQTVWWGLGWEPCLWKLGYHFISSTWNTNWPLDVVMSNWTSSKSTGIFVTHSLKNKWTKQKSVSADQYCFKNRTSELAVINRLFHNSLFKYSQSEMLRDVGKCWKYSQNIVNSI